MYRILGEDDSDVDTIAVLIRRIANQENLAIKKKGFGGCGNLLRKGAIVLQAQAGLGCTRFVITHDADGTDAAARCRRCATPS